ncbi:MAG: ChaN family lipoprotein [Myxococcota bacterium]
MKFAVVCSLCLAFACSPNRSANTPVGASTAPPDADEAPEKPVVPDDVVAKAAGPVRVVRLSDGEELPSNLLARELLSYDALCAGEEHTSAAQHFAELWLVERLSAQAPYLGLELGVGFEMWSTKDQGVVSTYAKGKISEKRLLKQTNYQRVWGYDFAYYRPVVNRARDLSLPLVALNTAPSLTERVAKNGLAGLDHWTASRLPELDLSDAEHRADFERRMQKHPGVDAENLDNYYAAQVLWDESMAEASARWLNLHTPVRRLLIVAGQAHCQRSAIPKRLQRRGARKAAALLLGTEKPAPELAARYDFAVLVESKGD